MAKVPKIRKKGLSVRSRASRRADVPTDKSLETPKAAPAEEVEYTPAVLSARQDSSAIKKKQKPLSRKQRLRREKGVERAYAITDQLENKLGKSKSKSKTIKERAADWEDVNITQIATKGQPKPKKSTTAPMKTTDIAMEDVVDNASNEKSLSEQQAATDGSNSLANTTSGQDDLDLIT